MTLSFAFKCAAYALMNVSGCTSRTLLTILAAAALLCSGLFLIWSKRGRTTPPMPHRRRAR